MRPSSRGKRRKRKLDQGLYDIITVAVAGLRTEDLIEYFRWIPRPDGGYIAHGPVGLGDINATEL